MPGFSPELLDEIRARADIVEVVGQFVGLKRAGVNYKGLCPFHTEKTPSFTVNPKRGIFHCFGCGAGGDAFGFLMRHDRLAFPEAVRALAERTGVELPTEREPEADGKFEALRRTMAAAAEFYARTLWEPAGLRAREYLAGRGVDLEVARRFQLGWAPEGWNALLLAMAKQSIGEAELVSAGLALPRQTGSGFYDRFRGRLLFPIRDLQGRVIAFGGRALGAEEPKYLNSPETPLYVKGQTLYALDVALATVRGKQRAIIVEGYLDCLMAHQHGFTETVATLGTAFTETHLALLRRYADEVIALFDADAAGQKAATRIEEMMTGAMDLQNLGWSVSRTGGFERRPGHLAIKVAMLPEGHDPDSLLRAEGAPALAARLEAARPLLGFVLDKVFQEEDVSTARGRGTAHARVALLLSKVGSADEATALAREAARRLGVDATQLWIEAQQLQGARARGRRVERPEEPSTGASAGHRWPPPGLAERDLLALLLHVHEARTDLLPMIQDEDVTHPGLRALLAALRRSSGPPEGLMGELGGEGERGLLASLLMEEREWNDAHSQVFELRKRYHIRRCRERVRRVREAIASAQATGNPSLPALEAELSELQREAEAVRELALARPEPPAGAKPGR